MRILHVTHELPPYELAGTGIYTNHIATAQARHHEVFIFARLQDPEIEPYRLHTENRDGLVIRFMNLADLSWSPFDQSYLDERGTHHFESFLDEVEPDVVHFQHIVGFGAGVFAAVRKRGIPIVYTLHDFWTMCPMGQRMCYTDHQICDPIDFSKCGNCVFGESWSEIQPKEASALEGAHVEKSPTATKRGFKAHYQRRVAETPGRMARRPRALIRAAQKTVGDLFRDDASEPLPFTSNPFEHRFNFLRDKLADLDLLITPSAFLRDQFIEHFRLGPHQIIHSANGMDFGYVKKLPKTPSERIRIGFIGTVIKTKGVHVLVEGFLRAAASHANIELHVHGGTNRWNQPYLEECEAMVASSGMTDRVTFHGRYDNRKVGELLSEIDLLVVPSIWFENAPLTLNEAAMTGTPIVVSNRGGMLEFVQANHYGRTFELGNSHALGDVLAELAAHPERLAELAGNPPPIKPVTRNAEELVGVYRSLIDGDYQAPSIEEQTRTRGGALASS